MSEEQIRELERTMEEEIKAAMVFLFTMPGVPFVYYGDEIGMDYIEGLASKEGGYNRTGARTPMQWNNTKNHGFSESDAPYLPTDERENAPTVEKQINDENSLLCFVKKLIQMHKSEPAFHAEGEFNVLLADYPFVYERTDGNKKLLIAVNPSKFKKTYKPESKLGKMLLSQNVETDADSVIMNGVSFIVSEVD